MKEKFEEVEEAFREFEKHHKEIRVLSLIGVVVGCIATPCTIGAGFLNMRLGRELLAFLLCELSLLAFVVCFHHYLLCILSAMTTWLLLGTFPSSPNMISDILTSGYSIAIADSVVSLTRQAGRRFKRLSTKR